MSNWILTYEGFDPKTENLREALCTLGNGYFATRGAAPEAEADDIHYPGTYLAGGYNRLKTEIAGRIVENEDLVNMPNWLILKFRPGDGDWFNLMSVEILSYKQEVDLKQGILTRTVRFRDKQKRETTVASRRIVHMGNMHLAAQTATIIPENWSGPLEICSALDGTVINTGVERYEQLNNKHLEPLKTGTVDKEGIYLLVQTNQSNIRVAEAARTRIYRDNKEIDAVRKVIEEPGYIAQNIIVTDAIQGEPVRIEKIVSFYTSKDFAISEPALEAVDAIRIAPNFQELLGSHIMEWDHLWDRCDIQLSDHDRSQMILRLHIFHILQTVSRNSVDLDIGVPARGWHGEAYRGHIFWDELFIFPYLNLRMPILTCSLLLYRYRRLDKARSAAKEEGLKGALYPWQSGSNGREETQKLHLNPRSGHWLPDNTHLQRHVNAAIAYNVWQYFEMTDDMEFMATYGAEIILEIARFLASITSYNREIDRYEICGVIGPDEYHDRYPDAESPGLNNNAYTNVMTVWVLRAAVKALEALPLKRRTDLQESIRLEKPEIEYWQDIIHKMRVVFHGDGIISQFEGYDGLLEFDWEGYRKKYGDIHRLDRILEAEGDTANRYKVSKQADVLMLFYLFSSEELQKLFLEMGYNFDPGIIPKNIEYYLERSSNGSTLSNIVHSWVLTRSDRLRSWKLFNTALESDISDIQGGTTHEGIHLGAMAGTVDVLQQCYTGMEFKNDVVYFNPRLPEGLGRLTIKIKYRGNWFDIITTSESLIIASGKSQLQTMKIGFRDRVYELKPGDTLKFDTRLQREASS
ncbi:MAG: glycoside hydrolase family 65 protein [Candidatus Loosdrechtia sp.]|uniref:glycoside hydrolase family 65 protein n=1 Tax=Candidatus Loosdrechtia sp. TaxID=3101272 RepID=UPI003A6F5FEE|nr:MAG: glycosyl hydrolase family 65 protein [Candidatus Jettenia sp. AMX2]